MVVYLMGDNGASGEGTLHGAWSSPSFQNGEPEDPEWLLAHIDDFGSPRCENHFNVGWAWALDAPFQWTKQVVFNFGGTATGWRSRAARHGRSRRAPVRSSTTSSTSCRRSWMPLGSRSRPWRTASREADPGRAACATRSTMPRLPAVGPPSTSRFSGTGRSTTTGGSRRASMAARRGPAPQAVDSGGRRALELYRDRRRLQPGPRSGRGAPGRAPRAPGSRSTARLGAYDVIPRATRPRSERRPTTGQVCVEGETLFTLYREHVRQPELALR